MTPFNAICKLLPKMVNYTFWIYPDIPKPFEAPHSALMIDTFFQALIIRVMRLILLLYSGMWKQAKWFSHSQTLTVLLKRV